MLDPSTFDLEEIIQVYESKEGGQKVVYIAKHRTLGKVALKMVPNDPPDPRVEREVDILMSIDSPYFPKVHKVNQYKEDDMNYLVIIEEFILGTELSQALAMFTSEDQMKLFAEDLLEGLNVLWFRNIVHRDIKPGNIIIRQNSKPVILDLGIAKQLDKESLTATCQLVGPCTPIYASPEQLENKKELIGLRTDMFSLGIVLYMISTQKHPFDLDSNKRFGQIIDSIIIDDPPKSNILNSEISEGFAAFIM